MLAEAPAGSVCRRWQGKWYQRSSFVWWSSSVAELSAATFSREYSERPGGLLIHRMDARPDVNPWGADFQLTTTMAVLMRFPMCCCLALLLGTRRA